jgi:SPP1 family predicted phage head-tail adaptor
MLLDRAMIMPVGAVRVSAGTLTRLITVERQQVVQDANYGSQVVTWVPLAVLPGSPPVAERFWAEVQDALPSRSESVMQGVAVARNQTRVRIRWRSDIDSSMRITVHGDADVIYQIVGGPAEIRGRRRMLEMMCERYSS